MTHVSRVRNIINLMMAARGTICALLLWLTPGLHAQQEAIIPLPYTPPTLESELFYLDRGDWASIDEVIKIAGPAKAIPLLEERFQQSKDTEMKEHLAIELWKLGDKKPAYVDFVIEQARQAVDSPAVFLIGEKGMPTGISPEFTSWAKAQGYAEKDIGEAGLYLVPGHLLIAAELDDWRADAIFRRGLASPNTMIAVMASQGLAKLQDVDALPLIIAVCESRPESALAIAMSALIHFDDPRAEAVARRYLSPAVLNEYKGQKVFAGKDPFHPEFPKPRKESVP